MYIKTKYGWRLIRQTTLVWNLLVQWKKVTEKWVPLKDLKESNPMELSAFESSIWVDIETDFVWWVPFNLRNIDMIIAAVNTRTKMVPHKYGVQLPSKVQEEFDIGKANGNTLWHDALNKDTKHLKVAFDIMPDGKSPPVNYTKASGNLIFDTRMTLERKSIWVK